MVTIFLPCSQVFYLFIFVVYSLYILCCNFKVNPLHAPQRKKMKINWNTTQLALLSGIKQNWQEIRVNSAGTRTVLASLETPCCSSEKTEIWEQMKALGEKFPPCVFILTKDIVVPYIAGWILIVRMRGT